MDDERECFCCVLVDDNDDDNDDDDNDNDNDNDKDQSLLIPYSSRGTALVRFVSRWRAR
jgi:hypothetical protein